MMRILATVALVVAGAIGRADELEDDFVARRAAAAEELVDELLVLASWCDESKLYLARDQCYETVLRYAPDDETARAKLGYSRDASGGWREPKNRKPARNFAPDALPEYERRRGAAVGEFRDALLAALEPEKGAAPGERVQAVRAELLELAPDDPVTRLYFGEARLEDAWVLVETLRGKERRPQLKELVREAQAAQSAPAEVEATAREAALGLEYEAVLVMPYGRVLGTAPRAELEKVARALGAARALFDAALGTDAGFYEGATVFVLAKKGDKETFLAKHPEVDDSYRAFLTQVMGSGIQGSSDMAHWSSSADMRLDGLVRIAVGWLLYQGYTLTTDAAWLYEGIGLYLTRELVGSRLTWSAVPSEYMKPREEAALRARLLDPKSNWMNEAYKLVQQDRAPNLRFVVGKKISSLTTEDMLMSYVAAAYLLEGRPDELPALLAKVGSGSLSLDAIEEVLGLDALRFHERVVRWLGERR